jgi:hypothetical protein
MASSALRNQIFSFLPDWKLQNISEVCGDMQCCPPISAPKLKLSKMKEPLRVIEHWKLSPLALNMRFSWLLVPSCLGAVMVQLERRERQPTGFSQVLPLNLFFWVEYPLILQNHIEPGGRSPRRLLVQALPGKAREESCRMLRLLSSIQGLFHIMDQKQELGEETQGPQAPDQSQSAASSSPRSGAEVI